MFNNSKIALYANDTKLYKSAKTIQDCLDMSDAILSIETWIGKWQMRKNIF